MPVTLAAETAHESQARLIESAIDEREQIVSALADCPEPLAELRTVLLQAHEWRAREGLT